MNTSTTLGYIVIALLCLLIATEVDWVQNRVSFGADSKNTIVQKSSLVKKLQLTPIKYNNPGLVVDLGVGLWAWPLPMDFDGDGDFDLVVDCPDVPYNGIYFFENDSKAGTKMPVFKPAVRLAASRKNIQICYVDGKPRILIPGHELIDFQKNKFSKPKKIYPATKIHPGKTRANQWTYADYDGDGVLDLIVGVGDWTEYGWDNAFNSKGQWTRGPLHGFVYLLRNNGSTAKPKYEKPVKIQAGDKPIDVYGRPSPNLADFDGDGDLDIICGEFLDKFTYFENIGNRKAPKYTTGRRLTFKNQPLAVDLQMFTAVALDWDRDGDVDLIIGDEDGRVALVEHTGKTNKRMPQFLPPKYFQQQADYLKCSALATPYGFDWDGDGDDDIISGNTAGYIMFFENLGPVKGSKTNAANGIMKWAAGKYLSAAGKTIRIQAGKNGSIQGPYEAKWGYTTLSVNDWDGDGLPDIMANSIWGKIVWYKNIGSREKPKLAAAKPVQVKWENKPLKPAWNWWNPQGNELVTQWRTTPVMIDWDRDGLMDLVMLDHEGYLVLFKRVKQNGKLHLQAGKRIFQDGKGGALRLNNGTAGKSGRRKIAIADWDGDTRRDLLLNSRNVQWWIYDSTSKNKSVFKNMGDLSDQRLAGHTTSPTVVDWNHDGVPDLLVGAEDGRMYYAKNTRVANKPRSLKKDKKNLQLRNKLKPNSPQQKNLLQKKPAAKKTITKQPGLIKAEMIYDKAPFPSCHASTIAETKSGLIAAWFGGTREKHPDVGIWISRNTDGKWSKPVEVANGVQSKEKRYPCWNPVLFQPKKGPLMLFFKVGPTPSRWWGEMMVSYDKSKTWKDRKKLPDGGIGPVKNKPIQLADGTILCGVSSEHAGWRVHFARTTDLGKTWTETKAINDGKKISAIQPSILIHPKGKLQALGRSRQGRIWQTWSTDAGKTWSEMTLTNLPNPSAGTDAVTLADGRHLLIYNHTRFGRSPLNVAISSDGKNWQGVLVLENQRGEYSYPAIIQTADGLVHATYTYQRKKIKHVVIDPKKLKSRKMDDGKWPKK